MTGRLEQFTRALPGFGEAVGSMIGTIHATGRRRHRGRSTWVWEVDITDDEGRLCALVRMTVAVR